MKGNTVKLNIITFMLLMSLFLIPAFVFASDPCESDDVQCWIDVLKKGQDSRALRAMMELGRLKSPESIPELIKKLESSDKYAATAAIYALEQIGEPAVPALTTALDSKNPAVRKYAAYGLSRIGNQDITKALKEMTRDDDPGVRRNAARALGKRKAKESLSDLITLMHDQYRPVRQEASWALGEIGDPVAIQALIQNGVCDLAPEVGMEASAALVKIGTSSIQELIKSLHASPLYVRKRVVPVLAELAMQAEKLGDTRAVDELAKLALDQKENLEIRKVAVMGLGFSRVKRAVVPLEKLVYPPSNNNDPSAAELKELAKQALEHLESAKTAL